MQTIFRLIYVSSAVEPLTEDELVALLADARDRNSQLGITGMLLYKDGNFLQLLEGDETAVRTLMGKITRDARHHGTIVLHEERASTRLFADWSMGFRNLADPAVQAMPGFSRFMRVSLDARGAEPDLGVCWDLLRFFRDSR